MATSNLFSLPTILEQIIARYITANYSGSYAVNQGFSTALYELPLILVKVGRLVEESPFTHVYKGELVISIHTQIDDAGADAVTIHDNTVAAIYDIVFNESALTADANTAGNNLHLYNYYNTLYDQELNGGKEERSLVTLFTFAFHAQTEEITQSADVISDGGLSQ